jgi:hypothetical protein
MVVRWGQFVKNLTTGNDTWVIAKNQIEKRRRRGGDTSVRLNILSKVEIIDTRHERVVSRVTKRSGGVNSPIDVGKIEISQENDRIGDRGKSCNNAEKT